MIQRLMLMMISRMLIISSCTKSVDTPNEDSDNGNGDGIPQQADEGIFFTIETTGETVKAQFVPNAIFIAPSNETTFHAYIRDAANNPRGYVGFTIVGKGTNTWAWAPTVSFTYTIPNEGGLNTVYSERYVKGSTYPYSSGSVTIDEYGPQYTGYIRGTFSLTNAGKSDKSNVSIKGKFKCRRTGDQ